MDELTRVKMAVYRHFADTTRAPTAGELAGPLGISANEVGAAFTALRASRVLFLEPDGVTIRMAPPFSGVPTQHEVEVERRALLRELRVGLARHPRGAQVRRATVHSRCEQTHEPLRLDVALDGPAASDWLFHCLVPAAQWWDDIVFT